MVAAGCPAEDGGGTGGETSAAETSAADTSGATNVTATGAVDSTGDGSSGGTGDGLVPASGLHIDWVEANQGVGIPIGQDGAWVGPGDRIARLLQGRVTLIRAFWQLDADWEPREIQAHLVLEWPDGTVDRRIDSKMIEDDAFIGDLGRVFFWGIEAELAVPGLTYSIELYEADGTPTEGAPTAPNFFPSVEGTPQLIGIEDSYQLIKAVIVPFNYNEPGGGCTTQPDTSDSTMQLFEDLLYMQNPVDATEIVLHEPIEWNEQLTAFGQLNTFLSELRFDEGALPETYYYGLVDVCAGGLGDAGGQALGIPTNPTSMDAAYQRVSSGLSLQPDWSAETFVHEVGHSQGRMHVDCGGAAGWDPTYPFDGGDVGEWGFGVIDFQLRHPTVNKDYMTYCHPTWVGTWGWNKVQPVIETLSTWDANYPGNGNVAPEDPYGGSLLLGVVLENGDETWITVPGGLTGYEVLGDAEVEYDFGNGVTVRTPAVMQLLPDTDDLKIVAPLPDRFEDVHAITRVVGGRRQLVERGAVREHHHQRLIHRRR